MTPRSCRHDGCGARRVNDPDHLIGFQAREICVFPAGLMVSVRAAPNQNPLAVVIRRNKRLQSRRSWKFSAGILGPPRQSMKHRRQSKRKAHSLTARALLQKQSHETRNTSRRPPRKMGMNRLKRSVPRTKERGGLNKSRLPRCKTAPSQSRLGWVAVDIPQR